MIGTMASFVISRMKPRWGNWVSTAALFTYVIPASFLAIPFYKVISTYGLLNNIWALVFATVTFATPYAIWIFSQYATSSIPRELDEAAKVDGATVPQIFGRIFLPLMAPVLIAVGTYTLLLSWNEYLYAFLLLSTETNLTVPVAMGFFLATDDAPWNVLMATALIYAIPPAILYYVVRRYMVTGLTSGGVKG
jgi:multiple sugar transport system permease protein